MHTCVCNVVDCLGNLAVNIWDLLRNFQREHNDQPVTNPAGKRMGLWEQTPIINGFKTCFVYQWLSYCSSFSIVNWVGEVTVIYLPLKKKQNNFWQSYLQHAILQQPWSSASWVPHGNHSRNCFPVVRKSYVVIPRKKR